MSRFFICWYLGINYLKTTITIANTIHVTLGSWHPNMHPDTRWDQNSFMISSTRTYIIQLENYIYWEQWQWNQCIPQPCLPGRLHQTGGKCSNQCMGWRCYSVPCNCNHICRINTSSRCRRARRYGARVFVNIDPYLPQESSNENLFYLLFLATLHGLQDLSSLTRDRTCAPCSGSVKS